MSDDKTADYVFKKSEDFAEIYANNIRFEISSWDLKMILGVLDQSQQPNVVEQHTAVILPWRQVLLTAYYLTINLMIQQAQEGQRLHLPPSIMPAKPNINLDDPAVDETTKRLAVYVNWIHEQFFGANPYIPPELAELIAQQESSKAKGD